MQHKYGKLLHELKVFNIHMTSLTSLPWVPTVCWAEIKTGRGELKGNGFALETETDCGLLFSLVSV